MVKTNVIPQLISTNTASAANDIREIRAPVAIPNVWWWVGIAVLVLTAALLAWWLWRRRRPQEAPALPAITIPPHERAHAKLKEALELIDQPRPFCILVSDTLRIYIEERFQLRAPERTTEEFLEELQHSPMLTFDQKGALGEFLMNCDLVKFARVEPSRAELQAIHDAAFRLIEETQPPPPAPATAEPAASRAEAK